MLTTRSDPIRSDHNFIRAAYTSLLTNSMKMNITSYKLFLSLFCVCIVFCCCGSSRCHQIFSPLFEMKLKFIQIYILQYFRAQLPYITFAACHTSFKIVFFFFCFPLKNHTLLLQRERRKKNKQHQPATERRKKKRPRQSTNNNKHHLKNRMHQN